MAKRKRGKRISIETVEPVEFIEVQQRKLLEFTIDLTGSDVEFSHKIEQAKGAIVKLIVRYRAGDEQQASRLITKTVFDLKKAGARYVRSPKREVMHNRAMRMPEITHDLLPIDAAKKWLEIRPSRNYKAQDVLKELERLIKKKEREFGERLKPLPIAVRGIMVEDFMPFKGQFVIDDIQDGVFGIIGKYDDEDQRSNRAGKSAFLDGVFYSIFGESRKVQTLDRHINDDKDRMSVGIALETEANGPMTIVRSIAKKKRSNNALVKSRLFINDAEISAKEGKELVQNTLGTTREDFSNTCYVRQGTLTHILEQTSSQLKENIVRWKGLGVWYSIALDLARKIVKLEKQIDNTKMQIEIQKEDVEVGPPSAEKIEELKAKNKEITDWNKKVYASRSKIKELDSRIKLVEMITLAKVEVGTEKEVSKELLQIGKEIEEIREKQKGIEGAKSEVKNLQDRLSVARYRDGCKASLKDTKKLKHRQKDLEKELQNMNDFMGDLSEEIGAVKLEHAKNKKMIEHGFDGACVIDGEHCPRAKEIDSKTDEMKSCLQKIKDRILHLGKEQKIIRDKQANNISELNLVRSALQDCERNKEWIGRCKEKESVELLQEKIERLLSFIDNGKKGNGLAALKNRERFLIGELAKIEKSKELIANNPRLPSLKTLARKRAEQVSIKEKGPMNPGSVGRDLKNLEYWQGRFDQALEEMSKHKAELKELEEKQRLYTYLGFLCGKNGIPSMMIEDSINEITVQVNEILKSLGTDHRLEFRFEREIQSLAKSCYGCGQAFPKSARVKICDACGKNRGRERVDELKPMVREGDRLQEFAQESGAGRALLALATRIVLSRFLGYTVLFLDEVCSSLDDYHLPTMIRLIRKLPKLGFKQVFVISHQKEIAEAMPRNIMVVRHSSENRSQVEWE